ncbi:Gp49 family protein [Ruminococcus bromii]|uniref:Gp49 family protein n=1 Tax=Ruminococcus bromii TaxID=40518 RepID=UPI00258AAEF9|nr:Gp49 family protein [uncultured Ruminococcus sp.]
MTNSVTKRQIDELLEESEIKVETVYDKVTIVTCKLPNGFVITESSGAVSPANYDKKIGTEICMERIENKLWELEGYALAKQLYEGFVI